MFNKASISIMFVSIISSSIAVAKTELDTSTLKEMKSLRSQYKLPSLSVAVAIDDDIVFAQAIGFSDINNSELANAKTQYSVGSLAKPMTGLALANLVDSGKISLRRPVSTYVKSPKYTTSFNVEELAAHIAGVPHDTPERDIAEFEVIKDHTSPSEAFYVFDKHPLLFSPGSEYRYSSNGYILLSAVIEKAAETNYVDFLKGSLWKTFKMNNTELDTSFAGLKNEATYYADYNAEDKHIGSIKRRDRSFLFGGGGFISTPSDLVRMAKATYSAKYLSDNARGLLSTPVKMRNGKVNSDKYSLGWRVGKLKLSETDEQSWTALHHGGVTDNASTAYLLVIPQCRASIAFATNYVPNKFWRIRGGMARILKSYIDSSTCSS